MGSQSKSFFRKEGGTYQAKKAAHAKQEGKKEQNLDLEQEQSLGVEHLAGKRGCMGFMERSLDLIRRQQEATEGFKLGCDVMYLERLLFGKLCLTGESRHRGKEGKERRLLQ